MENVALILLGAENIDGGGGAERFFADLFLMYQKYDKKKFNLLFIIDDVTDNSLKRLGRPIPRQNILILKTNNTRFKNRIEDLRLAWMLRINHIKILHFALYTPYYLRFIKMLNKYRAFLKTRSVINIVNCEIPHAYYDSSNPFHQGYVNTYRPLFEEDRVDGYFCWNKLFIDFIERDNLLKSHKSLLRAIESRFSNTELYYPIAKEDVVVFAGRLDFRKRPDWYIDALGILMERSPAIFNDLKFLMFGKGPMAEELEKRIVDKGLSSVLKLETNPNLWTVLRSSKVFISCQDYDNFPSLAIAEAMASGNAIIARNVGQTDYFVKHKKNGLIIEKDSPEGLADSLEFYWKHPELHAKFENESVRLIRDVHNSENFFQQIENFWKDIIDA